MARELEYLDDALSDVIGAVRWLRREERVGSGRVQQRDRRGRSAIAASPESWPSFEHGTRRYLLRRFPFSVIYRIESGRVVIVAVAHARRRPGLLEREGAWLTSRKAGGVEQTGWRVERAHFL